MQLIYESRYLRVEFSPEYSILLIDCHNHHAQSEQCFRREVLRIQEIIDAFRPPYLLINKSNFAYSLTFEQREWMHEQIIGRAIFHGMQKFAVVMSDDIYAQMAMEEMFKCGDTENKMEYFSYQAEAYDWLISSSEEAYASTMMQIAA